MRFPPFYAIFPANASVQAKRTDFLFSAARRSRCGVSRAISRQVSARSGWYTAQRNKRRRRDGNGKSRTAAEASGAGISGAADPARSAARARRRLLLLRACGCGAFIGACAAGTRAGVCAAVWAGGCVRVSRSRGRLRHVLGTVLRTGAGRGRIFDAGGQLPVPRAAARAAARLCTGSGGWDLRAAGVDFCITGRRRHARGAAACAAADAAGREHPGALPSRGKCPAAALCSSCVPAGGASARGTAVRRSAGSGRGCSCVPAGRQYGRRASNRRGLRAGARSWKCSVTAADGLLLPAASRLPDGKSSPNGAGSGVCGTLFSVRACLGRGACGLDAGRAGRRGSLMSASRLCAAGYAAGRTCRGKHARADGGRFAADGRQSCPCPARRRRRPRR